MTLVDRPEIPSDFGFAEDHELLRDSARRFLSERCPIGEVRRLIEDPLGHDPGLWKEMAELGWAGLTVPEAVGGAGLGSLHLALLLEEMGRCLVPSPLLPCLLASFALSHAGNEAQRAQWLPALASGDLIATLALSEAAGSWRPGDVTARAEAGAGGYVLRGEKTHVLAGGCADLVVAPFVLDSGDGIALFAVPLPARGVSIDPEVGIDPTRRCARLSFEGVTVPADARLEGDGLAALQASFVRGYAALAAEMVGAGEATLGMTRDYAAERRQFDRPIGAFQAVKHPLVDMMVGVELARSHAYAAAAALDHTPESAETLARMAKALSSDVLSGAVRTAVQLHGGYGFTWDADVHLYFKRALWSRATLGDGTHHRRHLAERLLSR